MRNDHYIGKTLKRKVDAPNVLPQNIKITTVFNIESAYYSNYLANCTQNKGNSIVIQSSHISYLTDKQIQLDGQILDDWYEIQ